jgi:hypothetical protein
VRPGRQPAPPEWDRAALASSPPLGTVRDLLAALPAARFPTVDDLNAVAVGRVPVSGSGAPVRFVDAQEASGRGADAGYEAVVYREGRVPTRGGSWHDLFNALAWLAFPRTKAVLNRLHVEELERRRGEAQRGPVRDRLTVFDEGGLIVLCADPTLGALLAGFQWRALFVARRADVVRSMRFLVFGHAIHEKALSPYKGVTGKALLVPVEAADLERDHAALLALADARGAAYFAEPGALASMRSLHPLPVLGIPGWTAENEDAAFYDDPEVFRPGYSRPER